MLLVLEMPHHGKGSETCDEECVDTMGFKATFALEDCPACTRDCLLGLTWEKFLALEMETKGKAYTGGLGKTVVKRLNVEYGEWLCLRDWNTTEQIWCGARNKELACFWFEAKTRTFDFQGLNGKTRLVNPAHYERGLSVENNKLRGRTLATSPDQAHV